MKKIQKTNEELIEITDKIIATLVVPKESLKKAYNYYHGKRDPELFRYLEENFGLGNATEIEFIPLVKKHIDALIGEYLETPIIPKVSCKDSDTISSIQREKELTIDKEVKDFLSKRLLNLLVQAINGKELTDKYIEEQINKLIEDLNDTFVSTYEIAALNVIEYLLQSRNIDIQTKLRMLLLDLLITGYTFYRVKETTAKNNICIEVLNPLNTFIDRNPDSVYIKDSYKAVIRKWMTKDLVLNTYGDLMSREDRKKIEDMWELTCQDSNTYYVRSYSNMALHPNAGIDAKKSLVVPGYPYESYTTELIPVYEIEWLETDSDFVLLRFETIRIGLDIYILKGLNENIVRSKDNPSYCGLSVNGVYFMNRDNEPFSLMLSCIPLLDRYDILHFYRDNLIANSGTSGDFVDISLLPKFLGDNAPERLKKYIAYKKNGIAPIDSSLEGRVGDGLMPLNTIFGGFDDSVKAPTIQAILIAIDSIEQTCSSITGVFRERLNGIQLHDAVTNVKTSVNNSFTITKPYYQLMDLVVIEMLTDSLDTAKVVFKNGLTGTIILGDKKLKVFTALPEKWTLSDWDIHVITSTTVMQDMLTIKQVVPLILQSNQFPPEAIVEVLTAKSLSELKLKVTKCIKKQKEENNQLLQLQQLLQQMQQQLEEAQKLLEKANAKVEQLNSSNLQLEQQKLKMETEIAWFKAKTERTYREAEAENDKNRTQIELAQLYDGNPYNDTVKQLNK